MVIPIVIGALGTATKGLVLGLDDLKKKQDGWRPSKLLHYLVGQNTENSPDDLGRLAVTQTPVKTIS